MGQMERGDIGETRVEEELIPDTTGVDQGEDTAIVKHALKELLAHAKELGSRLHRVEEKSYTSAASGSVSHARSAGVVDANAVYPPGVSPEKQFLPGQVFYTDGFGLCCQMGRGCLSRVMISQEVATFNRCRRMSRWRWKKKCQCCISLKARNPQGYRR